MNKVESIKVFKEIEGVSSFFKLYEALDRNKIQKF